MEINDISNDINLEQMRREKDKAYDMMTYIVMGACLLIVLFLTYLFWSRRKHMRLLMARNHQLTLARDQAQEADRMKTAFIQNVSHQIRTPLNAVSGFSTILAQQSDELTDEERQDLARRIEHSAGIITNSLNHLIIVYTLVQFRIYACAKRVYAPCAFSCIAASCILRIWRVCILYISPQSHLFSPQTAYNVRVHYFICAHHETAVETKKEPTAWRCYRLMERMMI